MVLWGKLLLLWKASENKQSPQETLSPAWSSVERKCWDQKTCWAWKAAGSSCGGSSLVGVLALAGRGQGCRLAAVEGAGRRRVGCWLQVAVMRLLQERCPDCTADSSGGGFRSDAG